MYIKHCCLEQAREIRKGQSFKVFCSVVLFHTSYMFWYEFKTVFKKGKKKIHKYIFRVFLFKIMKLKSIKEEQAETRRLLFIKNTNYITERILSCR